MKVNNNKAKLRYYRKGKGNENYMSFKRKKNGNYIMKINFYSIEILKILLNQACNNPNVKKYISRKLFLRKNYYNVITCNTKQTRNI